MHICTSEFSTPTKACNAFPRKGYRQQHQRGPPRPLPWALAMLFSWTLGFLHLWSVLKSILFLNRKYLGRDSALTAWCPIMAQKLGIIVTPLPRHPGRSASLLTGFYSYHLLWKVEPCHLMTRPHHWPSWAHHLGPTVYSNDHGMLQEEENIHASWRTCLLNKMDCWDSDLHLRATEAWVFLFSSVWDAKCVWPQTSVKQTLVQYRFHRFPEDPRMS